MEWLLDMVDLSDFAQQNKVTSNLTVKYGNAVVGIKAKTRHLECYIYEWEWQREKQEWNLCNLMNLCLTAKLAENK